MVSEGGEVTALPDAGGGDLLAGASREELIRALLFYRKHRARMRAYMAKKRGK